MMSVKKKMPMDEGLLSGCPVCAVTLHLHPPHSRESHTDTQEKSHIEPSWPYNTYTSQVSDPMVAARSPVGAGPYIRQYSNSRTSYARVSYGTRANIQQQLIMGKEDRYCP